MIIKELIKLIKEEFLIEKKNPLEVLKDNKIPLTPEEREIVMKAKAVWHPSNHDKPVSAIWKSKHPTTGKITYGSNTHRVYQTATTLKSIIHKYHTVVKPSA